MPKIPFVRRDEATDEQKRIAGPIWDVRGGHDSDVYGGPWGILLKNPELCARAEQYGSFLRDGASLPKRLSELVIAVTARHWNAQFEWAAHYPQGLAHGLSEDVMEAIRTRQPPPFTENDEQAVYDYAMAVYANQGIPVEIHARAIEAVGEQGVIAIVAIGGFYSSVAMICNSFDLEVVNADPPPPLAD